MNRPLDAAAVLRPALREPGGLDATGAGAALTDVRVLRGWLDAYEARVTRRIDELAATGASLPPADLHARDGGVSSKEAQQKERRAKVLDEAPALAEKLASGDVTAGHVDALANAAVRCDDETRQELLGLEDDLASDATRMSPEEFAKTCRDLVQRLERDHGVERDRQQRRETRVTKIVGPDGMYVLNARLHPELGNVVFNAIDAETARLVKAGGDRSADRSQIAAEALGNLVTGSHQAQRPAEAEIRVHVAAERLVDESSTDGCCEFDDGQPVPPTTVRRLLCNGRIVPIVIDSNGVVLNAGREQRLANQQQRRALRAMYRTCAFPGCDVGFNRCEIHHIIEFELGGRTDLADLLPLCCRHHHVVHELGLRLTLDRDRTLTIRERDGTLYAEKRLRPSDRSPEPAAFAGQTHIGSTDPPGDACAEPRERQLSLTA